MDLSTLAASMVNQPKSSKKDYQTLMPQQQQTRSYSDEPTINYSELIINVTRFKFGKTRLGWTLQYKINYPLSSFNRKTTDLRQIKQYAKDYLEANTDKKDLPYIDITKISEYLIEYRFNHKKWIKANFSRKPHFMPPTTLYWKYKIDIPRIIFVNQVGSDLQKFIEEMFYEYIDKRANLLKHKEFSFVQRMVAKLFTFKWDRVNMRMYAHLKYSVILGSLAIYMSLYHKKDANKYDIKKLQRKASNFGDVKKLDRYIKRLK